jgi:hypothetical protein
MSKFPWLRSSGGIGTFITNTIVLLTTNWTLVVSAALAIFVALVGWAYDIASNPHVQVGVGTFVAALWTCIGLVVLADRRKPRIIRAYQDYQYGLTFEGLLPIYDSSRDEGALQFGCQLRNYSSGPLRITMEQFDVRIGTRSLPKLKKGSLTSFLPRGAARVSNNVPFKKDDIKEYMGKRVAGTVEFKILYGHPEQSPVRRLAMELEIFMIFNENSLGFNASIIEEIDEQINIP